jgi:hypothetical protein
MASMLEVEVEVEVADGRDGVEVEVERYILINFGRMKDPDWSEHSYSI